MSPGIGGSVDDAAMQLRQGTKMLYPQLGGLDATGGLGTGAPVMAEIGAVGQAGLLIGADADLFYWIVLLNDLLIDTAEGMKARVHFCGPNVDTGIDWIATILGVAEGVAITNAVTSPDGTIAFPAAAAIASYGWVATDWLSFGVRGTFASDIALLLSLECDDMGTASADEIRLIGLELGYTLSLESGDGVRVIV